MKIKPMLGDFALEGVERIESAERRALIEHRVPGLAGSYYQDLGASPNRLMIRGSRFGDDTRDAFLTGIRDLFNKGTPTTFVGDITTATDLLDVVIETFTVSEAGGPETLRYEIVLRKYIEPPAPPEPSLGLGAFDDLLSEAGALTDALDMLDALSSLPSLSNPTEPVKTALDGVKTAASELPAITGELTALLG